jgi:hypothetical protein
MIDNNTKELIQWFDTDKTIAKDIIQNYEVWIEANYKDRLSLVGKDIMLDGKPIDINLECAKIAQDMFDDIRIKSKPNIKIVLKALANKNMQITNKEGDESNVSDSYIEEYSEISSNIDEGLKDLLSEIDSIDDNEWDAYKRWKKDKCMYIRNKEGDITGVDCCHMNLVEWLANFPLTKHLYYNKVRQSIIYNGHEIQDADLFSILDLCNKYLSKSLSNFNSIKNAVYAYAYRNRDNYLYDYIQKLNYVDDGKDYIDIALRDMLNCEDLDEYYDLYYEELKIHAIAYIKRVIMKEELSIPTKFDSVLVLCSKVGGSGKTTFFEKLYDFEGNGNTFCYTVAGSDFAPNNKDFIIQTHKYGCVCIDEVDMRRGLVNSIKGYMSKQKDEFRLPYGYTSCNHIRGFVISATSNNTDFLKDYTTYFERRWMIIHISETIANHKNVNKWFDEGFRDKFWAQIKHIYDTEEVDTWIDENSPLGQKLKKIQKEYKYYETDNSYQILDNFLDNDFYFYDITNERPSIEELVKQYMYDGDMNEYIKMYNNIIDQKSMQEHYIMRPEDRKLGTMPFKLDFISSADMNVLRSKLGLDVSPQGIRIHLESKGWTKKNYYVNGRQILGYKR